MAQPITSNLALRTRFSIFNKLECIVLLFGQGEILFQQIGYRQKLGLPIWRPIRPRPLCTFLGFFDDRLSVVIVGYDK